MYMQTLLCLKLVHGLKSPTSKNVKGYVVNVKCQYKTPTHPCRYMCMTGGIPYINK